MEKRFDVSPPTDALDASGVMEQAEMQAHAAKDAAKVASPARRTFLAASATACGAAALMAARPAEADILDTLKKFLVLDPIVLNYALEMEELQSEFFSRVGSAPVYNKLDARERHVFDFIGTQDRAHFELLDRTRELRGDKGAGHFNYPNASATLRPRTFQFPAGAFTSRDQLMSSAVDIKQNCVAAYHGAVDLLRDKKSLLAPAVAIAGVDGRHLAVLREIAGLDPIPSSFELQISPQDVGNRLAKYGFQGGAMRGGSK